MIWTFGLRLFFVFLLLGAESAVASHVKISDSNGNGTNTATASGEITLNSELKDPGQMTDIENWSVDWSIGQTDSNTNSIKEITRTYEAGLDYSNDDLWNLSAGGTYEKSQIGEVQSLGPMFTLSRSWNYGHLFTHDEFQKTKSDHLEPIKSNGETHEDEISAKEFKSSVGFSLTGKNKDFLQKAPRTNQPDFQVTQNFLEGAINWDPISWLGISTLYGKYSYDKDLIAFYNSMNRPAVTAARGSDLVNGFSSIIQAFTDYEYGVTLTFGLTDATNVDLGFTKSRSIVNSLWTTDFDLSLNSELAENIRFSLGTSLSNPSDNSGITYSSSASLSYYF